VVTIRFTGHGNGAPVIYMLGIFMTIGELLRIKTHRNLWLGLLAWLAFAGSMFVAAEWGARLLPLVLFLPFIGVVIAQMFFVRCPRCNGNLGQLLAQTMAPGGLKTQVTHCPFCGVSFNDHP
jgi:hypothetical protein